MLTVLVPTFDEFDNFVKSVRVKIKNVPNLNDVHKITQLLPGFCQGAVGRKPLADLLKDGRKDVRSFYDGRQSTSRFRGYFVTVENDSN
jgi:hypothetical protein